ncbi:MAG: hypothetical protein KIT19_04695 [Phycisphaeraceae bacterium]|nr:hypothetical protein [Phycisphaeraceae bacterium]
MSMMPGYEIARASGVCAGTGRPITVGESYIAALWTETDPERPGTELMRRSDYSTEAWITGHRPTGPLVGHWRATLSPPNTRKRALIGDDELLDLFMQLGETTEPKRLAFRYLLALILVRKRLLRVEGSPKRGTLNVRLKPVGDAPGEVVEVVDPGMDEAMIADATEQLSAVLANDEPVTT